jgi:hypothetical protein
MYNAQSALLVARSMSHVNDRQVQLHRAGSAQRSAWRRALAERLLPTRRRSSYATGRLVYEPARQPR